MPNGGIVNTPYKLNETAILKIKKQKMQVELEEHTLPGQKEIRI